MTSRLERARARLERTSALIAALESEKRIPRVWRASSRWEGLIPEVKALIDAGNDYAAISKRYGVSRERIRQIAKKYGLGGGRAAIRQKHECFVADLRAGATASEAALKHGYDVQRYYGADATRGPL